MDLAELPYSKLLGIRRSDDPEGLLVLEEGPQLHNHLGHFHASALFSLAESSSAEFLLRHRGDRTDVQGVVRRASVKYSLPANGTITSRSVTAASKLEGAFTTVDAKGRALFTIAIDLRDEANKVVARFSFTWFLTKE